MTAATTRATTMIAADTSNPRENPAASAWPEMLTWAEPAACPAPAACAALPPACAALLAVFATTVQATVPRIASPIEAPTTWPVLIRLEARPASASCTVDREVKVRGVNSGQVGHPGAQRAVPPDVLHEQGQEEEQAEHGRAEAQHHEVGARPAEVAEDPQRHQRQLAARLDDHERPEQDDRGRERGHHLGVTPVRDAVRGHRRAGQ